MNVAGFLWGVGGILLLLGFAVLRLGSVALEVLAFPLDAAHWALLGVWTPYMIWAEGYKGFFRGFAPRVVARARHLARHPQPLHVLLAPLYCMGYIHATRKRRLLSLALTTMIVCFVLLVRMLPQPWRGIIDIGVVAGLVVGMLSIVWFLHLVRQNPAALTVPTDVPVVTANPGEPAP
ncbi:MAG: hypothetical protein WEB57_14295 [Pseudohongiellaceae bacterium]